MSERVSEWLTDWSTMWESESNDWSIDLNRLTRSFILQQRILQILWVIPQPNCLTVNLTIRQSVCKSSHSPLKIMALMITSMWAFNWSHREKSLVLLLIRQWWRSSIDLHNYNDSFFYWQYGGDHDDCMRTDLIAAYLMVMKVFTDQS